MTARIASPPDDVKLRCAQLLRFAPALRVTSSSAPARCAYAESRAFGLGDSATIIKAASSRLVFDAQTSTRPRNRGRLSLTTSHNRCGCCPGCAAQRTITAPKPAPGTAGSAGCSAFRHDRSQPRVLQLRAAQRA